MEHKAHVCLLLLQQSRTLQVRKGHQNWAELPATASPGSPERFRITFSWSKPGSRDAVLSLPHHLLLLIYIRLFGFCPRLLQRQSCASCLQLNINSAPSPCFP